MPELPSPIELHRQAENEKASEGLPAIRHRYLELMREHGYLVPKKPGDDPNLPCGWPGKPLKVTEGSE
jgi:hypothetical protein